MVALKSGQHVSLSSDSDSALMGRPKLPEVTGCSQHWARPPPNARPHEEGAQTLLLATVHATHTVYMPLPQYACHPFTGLLIQLVS